MVYAFNFFFLKQQEVLKRGHEFKGHTVQMDISAA